MKNSKNLQVNLEEALSSLDGLRRAEANPFLYGKIQQTVLFSKHDAVIYNKWMFRLSCMVVLLIAINIFSISSFAGHKKNSTKASGIEVFAKEYNIETTGENI